MAAWLQPGHVQLHTDAHAGSIYFTAIACNICQSPRGRCNLAGTSGAHLLPCTVPDLRLPWQSHVHRHLPAAHHDCHHRPLHNRRQVKPSCVSRNRISACVLQTLSHVSTAGIVAAPDLLECLQSVTPKRQLAAVAPTAGTTTATSGWSWRAGCWRCCSRTCSSASTLTCAAWPTSSSTSSTERSRCTCRNRLL